MVAKKKGSNVNLDAAAKVLENSSAADDAFVRGSAKTSKRQNDMTSKRRMTVYIPEDLATELELESVRQREPVSGLVEKGIRLLLKR